jgi:hypothetical protein
MNYSKSLPVDLLPIIDSVTTGAKSPEEILDTLEKYGIEWYLSEGGTLMIKYWQVGAEGFVTPEKAAIIMSTRQSPDQADELDWLSKNLQSIRDQFAGQWVAVHGNAVVAGAPDLSDLMNQITEYNRPFITFIPADPVLWTFTYAN